MTKESEDEEAGNVKQHHHPWESDGKMINLSILFSLVFYVY